MNIVDDVHKLSGVGVPVDLLADPDSFGGTVQGDLRCGTLILRNGRVSGLAPGSGHTSPERLVLPRLTEAHVHLDKCHSVDRCSDVGAATCQRRSRPRCATRRCGRLRILTSAPGAGCPN